MTALHWAAHHDDLETAKALVDAGANVKAENRYGVTPLSLACQNGNAAIVELLLARGADPNTTLARRRDGADDGGAHRQGRAGAGAARSAAPIVNAKERRGQTALMWAAADGHAAVVELLLKAGADFRTPLPDSGFTPLFFAARDGRTDVVRVLLKAGADVNEAMQPRKPTGKGPSKGTSALLLAVENGHFELALDLIEAGADPNDQRSGFTPLHVMTWVRKPQRGEDDGDPAPLGSGNLSSIAVHPEAGGARRGRECAADARQRRRGTLTRRVGATPFLMAAATADVAYMRLLVELGANPVARECRELHAADGRVRHRRRHRPRRMKSQARNRKCSKRRNCCSSSARM